jgi:hypothetical protein
MSGASELHLTAGGRSFESSGFLFFFSSARFHSLHFAKPLIQNGFFFPLL